MAVTDCSWLPTSSEKEAAQLKRMVASLQDECEIVRKMWAADVDRLAVELSQARASALDSALSTRELFVELERMEVALAGERQRTSALLEEKAARDLDIDKLAKELERSQEVSFGGAEQEEVESLEGMLKELMADYERVEAKNLALAEEVWSFRNSGVFVSSLDFTLKKKTMLMDQETAPSSPRSWHTDEEPEMEHSVLSHQSSVSSLEL